MQSKWLRKGGILFQGIIRHEHYSSRDCMAR
jgi:hypothetical protein